MSTFSEKMKNQLHLSKSDADSKRAWIALLLNAQMNDQVYTIPSETVFERYGNDDAVKMTIVCSEFRVLIEKQEKFIHAEFSQTVVEPQIEKSLVSML